MYKITAALIASLLFISCTVNNHEVEKDEFFYFKSVVGGSPYETFGYRYVGGSGSNGPDLYPRRLSGDLLSATVTVINSGGGFAGPSVKVGDINARFELSKKGMGVKGSYNLDRTYNGYQLSYLTPVGTNPMYIDTTSFFSFIVTDTSVTSSKDAYANGTFDFTVFKNGAKTKATGTFRLKIN